MQFNLGEKPVKLQGLATTQLIEEASLNTLNYLETRGILLQVKETEIEGTLEQEGRTPTKTQTLIFQFAYVLGNQKGCLPLDHMTMLSI